jgi:hypothetical protein
MMGFLYDIYLGGVFMIQGLIVYTIQFIFSFAFLYYKVYKQGFFKSACKHAERLVFWCGLYWFIFVINLIYTGFMGWHTVAGSPLEAQLDLVCQLIQVPAMFMFFINYYAAKTEKELTEEDSNG